MFYATAITSIIVSAMTMNAILASSLTINI